MVSNTKQDEIRSRIVTAILGCGLMALATIINMVASNNRIVWPVFLIVTVQSLASAMGIVGFVLLMKAMGAKERRGDVRGSAKFIIGSVVIIIILLAVMISLMVAV